MYACRASQALNFVPLDFHDRCAIGEYPIIAVLDRPRYFIGQLLQSRPQHLVIVTPKRIAGNKRLVAIADDLPTILRYWHIVHAYGNHPQRARNEFRGASAPDAMFRHIIHFAMVALIQPLPQAALGLRPVSAGIGNTDLLEPQFFTPDLDDLSKLVKVWNRIVFR